MNTRRTLVGAVGFWLVTNLLGMFVTGFIIHQAILEPIYRANESFWRPELNQVPPDMTSLMPYWLLTSFLLSLVVAGIYSCVESSFSGPAWKKGLTWGLSLGIFMFFAGLGYSGVFNLPLTLWLWWGIDGIIVYTLGGAAMGWTAERFGG